MKILTVIGARPQFIKAASVSRVLIEYTAVKEILVHTGQHYDKKMSQVFFDELGIPQPAYYLGVGSLSHGAQTGQMMAAIEQVLLDELPDWVLVYGDTNSTLAGALAAVKVNLAVAHVEAGLRSFNRRMPEEINRVLTDHASDLLFAPTEAAVANLTSEGLTGSKVCLAGDVMYDAALHYADEAGAQCSVLARLSLVPENYVLATVHRAENTDDPARLTIIFEALSQVASQCPVVVPLHPRTHKHLARLRIDTSQLTVIDPVGYLDMMQLERHAKLIATDSGGVQKEAYFYRVPCVTLREETEWIELVEHGWNRVVPPHSRDDVRQTILDSLHKSGNDVELYGGGQAARTIVAVLAGGAG